MSTLRLLILVLLSCLFFSCIVIKHRYNDDGSTILTKQDSMIMSAFVLDSAEINHNYKATSNINFQIIRANDLEMLIKQKPYNWIFIGSSWCPVSDRAFKKYSKVIKEFPRDSIQFIYINQDYNLKELKKMILASSFTAVPYLLDSKAYGTEERTKQENFYKDLKWDVPSTFYYEGGVPKVLLTYRDQQILYLAGGMGITSDTIRKYTTLK